MRGAGLRLNNDVRRIWRCAACGAERKIGAQVTAVNCQCAGRPAMKLIETMRHERPLKELAATYMEFEFEPGELAPPRPRQEEEAPAPNSDTKLDFEMPAGRTTEGAGGDDATPPEGDARRSAPSQRPSRPNDRRGDRSPNPQQRGPQGRQENRSDNRPRRDGAGPRDQQPRRDQPPRREQGDPQTPRPENSAGENSVPSEAPSGAPAGRRRNRNRRGNRSGNPKPPGDSSSDNSSFGEGIPSQPPAPTQE
jgi:hypothetical protein